MMKHAHSVSRPALVLFLAGLCSVAEGTGAPAVGRYDFDYLLGGDQRARPVQVFDDGSSTYFQFRAGEAVPAIFALRSGVPELVVPVQEGPYVRVPQVHGRFLLQVGRAQAQVIHGGAERADAPPVSAVAATGMAQPYHPTVTVPAGGRLVASLAPVASLAVTPGTGQALDRNSYATPARGDRVYWPERSEEVEHSIGFARGAYLLPRDAQRLIARIAGRAVPASKFTVIGRDDDSYKEGLERARAEAIRDALVKAGVERGRITLRTGVMQPGARGRLWESTLLVETPQQAPPLRWAADVTGGADSSAATRPSVASNIEALVREGVLDRAQAQALLARSRQAASGSQSRAAPASESPAGGFTLSRADRTVSGAVRRWARSLHYEVVWDAPAQLDAAITGEATLRAQNLTEAMDYLLRGLRDKGYALEVTIYANRVIRFTAGTGESPKPAPALPPNAPARAGTAAQELAQEGSHWLMLPRDRTVAGTLSRWGEESRWRLVWSARDQVGASGDAVIREPDFPSAAQFLVQQLASAGYRLRTSTRGDKTVVVSSY